MKKTLMSLFLITILVLPMITVGAEEDNVGDVDIHIRGGMGYSMTFENYKPTSVIFTWHSTYGTGLVHDGGLEVPGNSARTVKYALFGFGFVSVQASAVGTSVSRLGFCFGAFVIFLTPPYL